MSFPVVWPREPSSWRTSSRRAPSVCTGPTPCSIIYSVRQRHTCASSPTGTRTQTHLHVLHSADITDRLMQNHWCTHTLPYPSAASKCRFTLKRKGLWMCNCRHSQMYKSEPKPMKIWWGWLFLTAADHSKATAALTKLKLDWDGTGRRVPSQAAVFWARGLKSHVYQGITWPSVLNLENFVVDIAVQNWLIKAHSWGHNMYSHRLHTHTHMHTVLSNY